MAAARRKEGSGARDWYKISVDSLRGCATFVLLLLVAAGAYWGYRAVKPRLTEREANLVIAEAGLLLQRVEAEAQADVGSFRSKIQSARTGLERARSLLHDGSFAAALSEAKASRATLGSLLEALLHRRPLGDAHFVTVKGAVEFRRGDRGEWRAANGQVELSAGDYVKTGGSGLAEIMFGDGTLYTVRPNTLFVVRSGGAAAGSESQSIAMEYGWVNLSTSERASLVATPGAEARLERRSEGEVAWQQGDETGRFAAFSGNMEVVGADGARRQVGALEEVRMVAAELSAPRRLPGRPVLLAPGDHHEVDADRADRLELRWQPVEGAARYALEIAHSRLFVDKIIDVEDRTSTLATLGLRGPGSFVWRVAAYGADGAMGPWSELQRFRVTSSAARAVGREAAAEDAAPPPAGPAGEASSP